MASTRNSESIDRPDAPAGEGGGVGVSQTPSPPHPRTAQAGAPPSNTAPANCISDNPGTRILRSGVDSLYLSYPGQLPKDQAKNLEILKSIAQMPEAKDRARAHIHINDHQFEVRDRGKSRFPYVLVDNWFHLQVSGEKSGHLPLVYAQIRSHLLTASGWGPAVDDLSTTIEELGGVAGQPSISRIDLCVDFVTAEEMSAIPLDSWVGRARNMASYYSGGKFTGYTFGASGDISARLYDKTEELRKSYKHYLVDNWRAGGWDGIAPVWRLEFQFKRAALRELSVEAVTDLEKSLSGLWRYGASDWLRLAVANASDSTRSRWPTHYLWEVMMEAAFCNGETESLKRVPKSRAPEERYLFQNGISGITSYMAKEGIFDFQAGLLGFVRQAMDYHQIMGRASGVTLHDYALGKAREKAKRYNTPLSSPLPDPDGKKVGEE